MQIVPYTTNEVISLLLSELKLTLNNYSDNLTLEQYDHIYGQIEELQYLLLDLGDN